jgi:flagellar protein FlbT
MALKITLKADERVIIGGAVLKNVTGRAIELAVENQTPLLREKEILTQSSADSPCKKVYLAIQMMYVDRANLGDYHKIYWDITKDVIAAAPSTLPAVRVISELVYEERYYAAMKEAKKLIAYEEKLIRHATKRG